MVEHGWTGAFMVAWVAMASGCFEDPPALPTERAEAASWQPDTCDPRSGEGLSGNLPNVPGLRGDEATVARAVAEAFGDVLVDQPVWRLEFGPDDTMARYNTTGGLVQVQHFTDGPSTFSYDTFHGGYLSRDVVETALARLGATDRLRHEAYDEGSGAVRQTWADGDLDRTGVDWSTGQGDPAEDGWWGSASIHGLHVLPGRVDEQPARSLRDWAEAFALCVLERGGATEAEGYTVLGVEDMGGYGVMHQSLVRSFGLTVDDPDPEAHCDTTGLVVEMDVETGAVAASYPYGCM